MAGDNVLAFNDANFDDEALKADKVVLVDFWAAWCGPCKMIAPVVEELAGDYAGIAKIGKLNVDENRKTAENYGVMSIPTLVVFKGGKEVDRVVGFKAKEELAKVLDKHV
jgi:thioredoxin 1